MSRISIDVTAEQHQRLKAMAALAGKSVKDFVLASTLGQAGSDEERALRELETLLDQRITLAAAGDVSDRGVSDIGAQVRREVEGPVHGA